MHTFDLIIRDGTIADGRRAPRFVGDVAVKDGTVRILGGHVDGSAARVIDADGLVVAPGFVDLHTHYDAQIRWDPWCTISGWHGGRRSCSETVASDLRRCVPNSANARC